MGYFILVAKWVSDTVKFEICFFLTHFTLASLWNFKNCKTLQHMALVAHLLINSACSKW